MCSSGKASPDSSNYLSSPEEPHLEVVLKSFRSLGLHSCSSVLEGSFSLSTAGSSPFLFLPSCFAVSFPSSPNDPTKGDSVDTPNKNNGALLMGLLLISTSLQGGTPGLKPKDFSCSLCVNNA